MNQPHSDFLCRTILVLFTTLIATIALMEFVIAMKWELPKVLIGAGMWLGAALWTIVGILGFLDALKRKDGGVFTMSLLCDAIAVLSINSARGRPTLLGFSLWANMVLWGIALGAMIWGFPKLWKEFAAEIKPQAAR